MSTTPSLSKRSMFVKLHYASCPHDTVYVDASRIVTIDRNPQRSGTRLFMVAGIEIYVFEHATTVLSLVAEGPVRCAA